MAYGHPAKPSRIWTFKARSPVAGLDEVILQFQKKHEYTNTLIALERERRERSDATLRAHHPEVEALDRDADGARRAYEHAEAEIRGRNQEARTRTATAADRARLKALKAAWALAHRAYREAQLRAYADPSVRAELEAIRAEHRSRQRAARGEASTQRGLYWGSYLAVERARRDEMKGPPPQFRRWTGTAGIDVQLQGGLAWEDALAGTDTRLRIEVQPPDARPRRAVRRDRRAVDLPVADPASARSRTKARALVWLRVGSDARKKPVWARVPIHLHRQPPPGTAIQWASLRRTIVGERPTWEVQFTLARDSWETGDRAASGTCTVRIRWTLLEEGLRVADVTGDGGRAHTLTIPRRWLGAWEKAADLRSIRDRNFDAIRDELAAWLRTHRAVASRWLRDELKAMHAWKTPDRLRGVIAAWRQRHRFLGDAEILARAEAWYAQDRHLHDWEDAQRRKAIRRRDDLYRKFARLLARTYRDAHLPKTDYRKLKARPGVAAEATLDAARLYRDIAAPGRLRALIAEAMGAPKG